jgi:hypothetical protein
VPFSPGPIGFPPREYVNMIHQLSAHVSTSPKLVSTDKVTLAGRAQLGAQRWFRISLETRDEKSLTRTKRGPSRALFAGLGPTTRLTPESIARARAAWYSARASRMRNQNSPLDKGQIRLGRKGSRTSGGRGRWADFNSELWSGLMLSNVYSRNLPLIRGYQQRSATLFDRC